MRLVSDREGNVSFGGEMLQRADGTPCLCEGCGKPLEPIVALMWGGVSFELIANVQRVRMLRIEKK